MRILQSRRVLTVGALAAAMLLTSQAAAFANRPATATANSVFTAYRGPNYTGRALDLKACGYNGIPAGYNGSYQFQYDEQSATVYNSPDATGAAVTTLTADAEQASPYDWQSVVINC